MWVNLIQIFPFSDCLLTQQQLKVTHVDGSNRLCHQYCSPRRPFQRQDAAGEANWMHPPYLCVSQASRHFRQCKDRNLQTCACILLPKIHNASWARHLEGMQCIKEFATDSSPLTLLNSGRQDIQTRFKTPLQAWFEGPGPPGPPPLCASMNPTRV